MKHKTKRKKYKRTVYNIILANHGKHIKTLDWSDTEKGIYTKFKKLLKENEDVQFPVRYNNHEHVMLPSDYELVIIKTKGMGDDKVVNLRDDMGNFIGYKTDNENWVVFDRAPYRMEETFWVYGYHPRLQRKTYQWILDNFFVKDGKDKTVFKTVQVYKNKLLIDINGNLEMVLCKNKDDAVKLYNMIEEFSRKNKFKTTLFMGDLFKSQNVSKWIDRIMERTGWDRIKVTRRSTRD